jgi:uncharacterized membrane protein
MKSLLSFIKTTLTGGILFLLPFVLIVILLKEVFVYLSKLSEPISKYLPEIIFGLDGSNIVALILLIVICFIAGLLFRSERAKKFTTAIEDNILSLMPGYALLKSITADAIGEKIEHNMTPILIKDDATWNLAFLVEEGANLSTVFIPDAPRHDAGEIKIIETHLIKKINVTTNIFARSIKNYGKGALEWLN